MPQDDFVVELTFDLSTEITLQASEDDGSLILFRNATLARAETNLNADDIDDTGIQELAASIAGKPIDVEHDFSQNCGVFTAGRPVDRALKVDGLVWADRYPEQALGIQKGTHQLSVEASAKEAVCSMCGKVFLGAEEYCDHLRMRASTGARRMLRGLRAMGGAITERPAGTDTSFDRSKLFVYASHQEDNQEVPMPNANTPDLQAELDRMTALVAELESGKKADQDRIATLEATVSELTSKQAESAQAVALLEAAKADLEAGKVALEAEKVALTASVDEATAKALALSESLRATRLSAFFSPEDVAAKVKEFATVPDEAFNAIVASLASMTPKSAAGAGLRLDGVNGKSANTKEPLSL